MPLKQLQQFYVVSRICLNLGKWQLYCHFLRDKDANILPFFWAYRTPNISKNASTKPTFGGLGLAPCSINVWPVPGH